MRRNNIISVFVAVVVLFMVLTSGCMSSMEKDTRTLADEERRERRNSRRRRKKIKLIQKNTMVLDIYDDAEDILLMGPVKTDAKENNIYTLSNSFKTFSTRGPSFGASISSGDINGDGIKDIIIGAPNLYPDHKENTMNGKVYLLFGRNNNPDTFYEEDYDFIFSENNNKSFKDNFGKSVAAGDLNRDGIDDIVIGAPFFKEPSTGKMTGAVIIYWGKKGLKKGKIENITKEADVVIYGDDENYLAGDAVMVKDVNGDGNDDLIIGAPGAVGKDNQRPAAGEVFVFFNSMDLKGEIYLKDTHDLRMTGRNSDDTRAFFSVNEKGQNIADHTGSALAAGDINGDGINDIIIGAPGAEGQGYTLKDYGVVYVVYGKKDLRGNIDLYKDADIIIFGEAPMGNAGFALSSADVTGDGKTDIIISAPFANIPGNNDKIGSVYVVSGDNINKKIRLERDSALILRGRSVYEKKGLLFNKQMSPYFFGNSLSTGDFNGDKIKDIAIGAPGTVALESSSRIMSGEVNIVYGTSSMEGEYSITDYADIVIYGGKEKDFAGNFVYFQDINRDGIDDLLIGAPGARGETKNVYNNGEAYIFYGGKVQKNIH